MEIIDNATKLTITLPTGYTEEQIRAAVQKTADELGLSIEIKSIELVCVYQEKEKESENED